MTRTLARGVLGLILCLQVVAVPAIAGVPAGDAYVNIDKAPRKAAVDAGERFLGKEFNGSRPLELGAVGPLPALKSDDRFGCDWTTAQSIDQSGRVPEGWIGVTRREGTCFQFQEKINAAQAAGADGLIVVTNARGVDVNGTAVSAFPVVLISQEEGERLLRSIKMARPTAVQVTIEDAG
ncbi:MAG: PA domain-containing protein [Actinomycetota bacterium]